MSEQRNLIFALVLSMAVLFGWEYFVAPKKPAVPPAQTTQQQTAPVSPQVPAPLGLPRAQVVPQSARVSIATPTLEGSINLSGGRFDDLKLRNYRVTQEPDSPEIDLLSPMGTEHPFFAEFGWVAPPGDTVPLPGPATPWTLKEGDKLAPGHDLTLAYDNGQGLVFTRHIAVDERYMFTVTDRVENHRATAMVLYPYARVIRSNPPVTTHFWVLHEGFIGAAGELHDRTTFADLDKDNSTQQYEGTGGWWGITDKYWMAAAIPPQTEKFTGTYRAAPEGAAKLYEAAYRLAPRTVAAGGTQEITHRFFAGAKVLDVVTSYRDRLGIKLFDYSIDWGDFWFLTKPIFTVLDQIYRLVGNFGIAILIFTVLVKLLFFPLANTSYRAMSKMKKLQPEMERLRARFKDDRVQQQQGMMELYKKEKVNPLAGCLPTVIQIPFFWSLYKVLVVTIEMRQAPFFGWIRDLSVRDPTSLFNLFGLIPFDPTHVPLLGPFLAIGALPILMGMTMWVQTNLNPPPADPAQAKMFAFMPLIFTYMLSSLPAGLVLYWTWNNLLSLTQQIVIMKRTGTPVDLIDRLRGMAGRLKRGEPLEKPAGPPD